MEKHLLVLKPSLFNALIPSFLKNLVYSFIVVLILFGVSVLLETVNIINTYSNKLFWLIILLIVFSIGPLIIKMIVLFNTNYYLFKTHVLSEFRFLAVKKQSVPYNQIVNISVDISIWDRVCNAGNITFHTADDKKPNVVLSYIKYPEKIEKNIYHLMHEIKKTGSQ